MESLQFENKQDNYYNQYAGLFERQNQYIRCDSPLPDDISFALADDDEIMSYGTSSPASFSDCEGDCTVSLQGSPYMSSSPIMMDRIGNMNNYSFSAPATMMGNNLRLLNDDLSEAQVMNLVSGIEDFVNGIGPSEPDMLQQQRLQQQHSAFMNSAQHLNTASAIQTPPNYLQAPIHPVQGVSTTFTPIVVSNNSKEETSKKISSKKPQRVSSSDNLSPSVPKLKRNSKSRSNSQYQELTSASILPAQFFNHRRASKSSNSSWRPFIESMTSNNNGAALPILPSRTSRSATSSPVGERKKSTSNSTRRCTTPTGNLKNPSTGLRAASPFEGDFAMNPFIGTAFSLPMENSDSIIKRSFPCA
jgi:hypothetical protein